MRTQNMNLKKNKKISKKERAIEIFQLQDPWPNLPGVYSPTYIHATVSLNEY